MIGITDEDRALVREYTEGNMDSAVLVQRGSTGPGVMDPVTLEVSGFVSPETVYTGIARIPPVSPSGTVSVGEGQVSVRQVTISIPHDADQVHTDDIVGILATQDQDLVHTTWRVIGVEGGGAFMAYRHLTCTAWYPSTYWDGTR